MMELRDYPKVQKCRFYEIEAIEIPIVYNKYGDHDPNGLLYVLKKDAARIKEGARRNFAMYPPQPYHEVKPLVIRANHVYLVCRQGRGLFLPGYGRYQKR